MHRDAVDAVAIPGRRRTVRKHVAEMPAAAAAMHFGPHHEVAAIGGRFDRPFDRREETGPPGAAFELAIGNEQRLTAPRAGERPTTLLVQQRTAARPLGAMLAPHVA